MATVTPEQRIADRIHANDLLLKQLQLLQERSEKCGELGDLVDCAYIDISEIYSDPKNFYSLEGIDELAANIELCGLQQPIRVRPDEDELGYRIVSGHRRFCAIRKLFEEALDNKWGEIPCIVECGQGSEALRELRLIYANSDTRKMTSADLSKQAERVEALLYQLKEEGFEFPGRMRDHVAEACKVSASKLARLKVIRDGLEPSLRTHWESGALSETSAYALAQLEKQTQLEVFQLIGNGKNGARDVTEWKVRDTVKLIALHKNAPCERLEGQSCYRWWTMLEKASAVSTYVYCGCKFNKCCSECSELVHCKSACSECAEKQKELKAQDKEKKQAEADRIAQRNAPLIEASRDLWHRFGRARATAGLSIDQWNKAMNMGYYYDEKLAVLETDAGVYSANDSTPFGFSLRVPDLMQLQQACRALNCSADYLLGLSDEAQLNENVSNLDTGLKWQTGEPTVKGTYLIQFPQSDLEAIAIDPAGIDLAFWSPADLPEVERWILIKEAE